jgi:hypothetical protein
MNILTKRAETGFRPEGTVEVGLDLWRPQYSKERRAVIHRDLLERLRGHPGVTPAAQLLFTPVSGSGWDEMVRPEGSAGPNQRANFNGVDPGYFRTMGTAFVSGRDFYGREGLFR